jgi:hypothetical protein
MHILRVVLRPTGTLPATAATATAEALRAALARSGGARVGHVSPPAHRQDRVELAVFLSVPSPDAPPWSVTWNEVLTSAWQQLVADGVTGWRVETGFASDEAW